MPKKKLTCSNDSSMYTIKNKYVACMQENLNKNKQTNKQTKLLYGKKFRALSVSHDIVAANDRKIQI